jgi:hypothetical protein
MNNSEKIGIVTVTHNSGRVLEQFLNSIAAQTYDNFVLYAVDSASQDNTLAQLEEWDDARLRIIPNEVNVGFAEGTNQGTRAALADGCDYVMYLNNDVEFEPESFANFLAEINVLDCDILAPKILLPDRIHIWSAGGTFIVLKGYLGFPIGYGEIDHGQYDTPTRIKNASGCCLLIRRTVFGKIGMLDVKFFCYHEDVDFLWRASRAGLTMCYTPRVRIFHKVSSLTGGPASPFGIRYLTRGHVYFMLKNLGVMRCILFLPAMQLKMVMNLLFRSTGWSDYLIRQRAFFEGIALWVS